MKTKITICAMVFLLSAFTGIALGGTEGTFNTFYGNGAGDNTPGDDDVDTFIGMMAGHSNTSGAYNTFLGASSGYANTTASWNTFLGCEAGAWNTTGFQNTFVGDEAGRNNIGGYQNTFVGQHSGFNNIGGNQNTFLGRDAGYWNTYGSGNVFLGNAAGSSETGSNKLYIDSFYTSTPLIYGEFDNRKMTIYGNLSVVGPNNGLVYLTDVTTDNTTKGARMVLEHYSNSQLPVYLFGAASTATNNFIAFGGGNTIGNAATQIDLFTAENTTTPLGSPRITIKGNGYVGIGTQTPSYPLQMSGGAYSNGGSWIDGSSREYKEEIEALSTQEAMEAIKELNPVKYAYKTDRTEKRVGFIAEEVPDLVATKDRKGLSSMDIVAVLTKVVQDQQNAMQEQQKVVQELKAKNEFLENRLLVIERKLTSSK
jgi:hypothetical protein